MKPVDPRVLTQLAPARWALGGMVAAQVATGLLMVAQAFAVTGLVVGLLEDGSPTTAAAWLFGIVLARGLTGLVGDLCSSRAAGQVTLTLRRRLLSQALRHPDAGVASGEVSLLATRGLAALEPYLTRYLPALVVATTLPPLTILAIGSQDLPSALIVLATIPLIPVFAILVGMSTRDKAAQQWALLSQLSGHFVDVVRGLPTLVAFRRADAQGARIREITHRYRRATKETLRLGFASSTALELVATLSVALVAVTVGIRLAGGGMHLDTALVVLLLAPEAYWPLRRVGAEFHAAAEGTATFEKVDTLLGNGTEPRSTTAPALPGELVLEGVALAYPHGAPVVSGLDARIPATGVTAVTGRSGAGKSTLLLSLLGDLEPVEGVVRVGPKALRAEASEDWKRQVAWVPQRPWLFAGSVADNVRVARPEADDAAVWRALELVGLGELVAGLPDGLAAEVAEDGLNLSAGQRARLSIARAVLAERPLVLLDEPTAHLDPESEQIIAETITWLGRRSAVVVVAHRPAIVALADQVVHLEETSRSTVAGTVPTVVPVPRRAGPTEVPATPVPEPSSRRGLVVGTVLGALAAAAGVALTATAGWLIVRASEQPPVLTLAVAIVGVRTFGLARPVLRYAERLASHDAALSMLAERRAQVYELLVPLTPGRLPRRRGDLLTSVVDDVDSLLDKELRVRQPLATALLVTAGSVVFASFAAPSVGVTLALGCALTASAVWAVALFGVRRAEPEFVLARARVSDLVTQDLQGARDLVAWQAVDSSCASVDRVGQRLARAATRSALATSGAKALLLAGLGATLLAVARSASQALEAGTLSAPMLALLVLLPLALADVLLPLADAAALSVRTKAADRRLDALAALEPAVRTPASPAALADGPGAVALTGVSAGWGDEPTLRNLSLHIPAGSTVGVVGPSGCGKSTLAALLLRFIDPVSGSVGLDGQLLGELALDDVRRAVGLVDDDPHLFASTLRENLRLASPEASDADLVAALRRACLEPWFVGLPRGLDTRLGDGGAGVSGGERARIGLARAVLADPRVLVLDEPVAHLDSATARTVADDLLSQPGRTVVWITHSHVGLDRVDRVLDLSREPIGQGVLEH